MVAGLPRCMDMISAADVIHAIERYYDGGALPPLDDSDRQGSGRHIPRADPSWGGARSGSPARPSPSTYGHEPYDPW